MNESQRQNISRAELALRAMGIAPPVARNAAKSVSVARETAAAVSASIREASAYGRAVRASVAIKHRAADGAETTAAVQIEVAGSADRINAETIAREVQRQVENREIDRTVDELRHFAAVEKPLAPRVQLLPGGRP